MELRPLNSSFVIAHHYDPETKVMHLQFRSGKTYKYEDVPADVHKDLTEASSPGGFFHQHIKSRFTGVPVE